MVSGTVTLFLVLSTLIINTFRLNNYLAVFVQGILEMTMSIATLSTLCMSDTLKVVIATMIISFGGLSIHMQVISSLEDKIKYRNYFIGRLYQMFISGIIAFVIMTII